MFRRIIRTYGLDAYHENETTLQIQDRSVILGINEGGSRVVISTLEYVDETGKNPYQNVARKFVVYEPHIPFLAAQSHNPIGAVRIRDNCYYVFEVATN